LAKSVVITPGQMQQNIKQCPLDIDSGEKPLDFHKSAFMTMFDLFLKKSKSVELKVSTWSEIIEKSTHSFCQKILESA
jgi:hypothetical protein